MTPTRRKPGHSIRLFITRFKLNGRGRISGASDHHKKAQPPLACPNPRYPASFRGLYVCRACGEKVRWPGRLPAHSWALSWANAGPKPSPGGIGQAFWYTVKSP